MTATDDALIAELMEAVGPDADTEEAIRRLLALAADGPAGTADPADVLNYWISSLDRTVSAQLNRVLHHPEFQALESTWRGLRYLVDRTETSETLKIKVLNVSKKDLHRDMARAVEFDLSALFRKVYEDEYGQLGGEPYGLLVGDYEFGRSAEDVELLRMVSNVAAAAHAPFVAAASPKLFNLDRFAELEGPRDLTKVFAGVEYAPWKAFRDTEDARYVALALPRMLARPPYPTAAKGVLGFVFAEAADGPDGGGSLWMSAAWGYAAVATAAYARHGWFMRTRGVDGGGRVEGLPVHSFPTDDSSAARKRPTETAVTDRRDFELSDLGFLPLMHSKSRAFGVFMSSQSVQKPKQYAEAAATTNAELSAKFNYMLSVSRFAHYLKVMGRDQVGGPMEAGGLQRLLHDWLHEYVVGNPATVSDEVKARKPLAAAEVRVQEVPGKPGWYQAVTHLRPHYQMETATTSLRLAAEIPKKA